MEEPYIELTEKLPAIAEQPLSPLGIVSPVVAPHLADAHIAFIPRSPNVILTCAWSSL